MIKNIVLFIGVTFFYIHAWSQAGCTDPKALNYNSSATSNNGSCTYPNTSVNLTNSISLSAALDESSALIFTDGNLWTLNDSGNPNTIFSIDPGTGNVLQTVTITNATNVDWEDLTADANYIYIGDFGNNAQGNRTNLRIYRVAKSDIGAGAAVNVTAEIINFSYQDQVVGANAGNNNTNYDCEAFLIKDNVLHLFSKDWIDFKTRHYTLANTPGTQVAAPVETFDVMGLITGADISANNEIVLIGYQQNLINLFMYLLYDYSGDNFFSGNKRRLSLGSSIDLGNRANDKGQIEGVAFTSSGNGYISSERISQDPFFVAPMLHSFSVTSFLALPVKMTSFRAEFKDPEIQLTWQTASEINSDFFSIQRSEDAIHFKEIGRETSAGNSNSAINYHYSDWQPREGMNYYRLKQVDIDGSAELSAIKTVKTPINATGKLKVYQPGSGNNRLIIDIGKSSVAKTSYQLININGAVLKEGILTSQRHSIDLGSVSKSQYIIRLSDGRSVRFAKK